MELLDNIFIKESESLGVKDSGSGKRKLAIGFEPDKVFDQAVRISEDFGMKLEGDENSVNVLEEILRNLHADYKNGYLEEPKLSNASFTFGVYLGEIITSYCMKGRGYEWTPTEGFPILRKNETNIFKPIDKVYKHIVHGEENDVRAFYAVIKKISEGAFVPDTE